MYNLKQIFANKQIKIKRLEMVNRKETIFQNDNL